MSRIWPTSFNKRFVDLVADGLKTQTIRANRKDGRRPVPGDFIHCYHGLRTKWSMLLTKGEITKVMDISIEPARGLVFVDNVLLAPKRFEGFATADGFSSYADMMDWWRRTHSSERFNGYMIQWIRIA